MNSWKAYVSLVIFILICYGGAALGAFLTDLSVNDWYPALNRPWWTPSGSFIGAVWTVLYATMAVAAWLVWLKSEGGFRRRALTIFAIQLLLNVAWSALFFGLRSPGLASAEVVFLWLAILVATRSFWRVYPLAGLLMLPYLLWVSFAAILNWTIYYLNAPGR